MHRILMLICRGLTAMSPILPSLFGDETHLQVNYKLTNTSNIRSVALVDSEQRLRAEKTLAARDASELIPYSVIVDNRSGQRVIAHAMVLTVVDPRGRTTDSAVVFRNFGVGPNGNEIAPYSSHIVTPVFSLPVNDVAPESGVPRSGIGSPRKKQEILRKLSGAAAVTVTVDLIVFGDGLCVGQDDHELLLSVRGEFDAEADMANALHARLGRGTTPSQIAVELDRGEGVEDPGKRPSYEAWHRFYTFFVRQQFASAARTSREQLVGSIERIRGRPRISFHRK